ncbi:hypothetical protein ACFWEF_17440, partial [Bacillus velezensis]
VALAREDERREGLQLRDHPRQGFLVGILICLKFVFYKDMILLIEVMSVICIGNKHPSCLAYQ